MPSHHARTKNQNENGLLQPIIMFLLFSTFYIIIPLMMFTYIIARTVYYCIIIILSGVLYNLNTTNKTNFIEATSQNYQDNEYWLNRCSICFDRKHEFCLNRCRDQFCKNCFSRYVQEVVNNSWGLNVTNVTCPVCRDVLPLKEWSKHVDTQTVKLYKTYNQPFRPLIRFCGSCQKPCFEPYVEYDEDIKTGKELLKKLKISYKEILAMMQLNRTQISYYNKEFKATYHYLHEGLASEGVWHYTEVMDTVKHLSNDCDPSITQSEDFINLVTDFSVELISAESKADIWKKLQFLHISLIPNVYCIECEAPVCLKCTAASHHIGSTCIEYLEQLSVSRTSVKDSKATLKWMVDNSKSCPSCHILIQREEGCNKVNCLYCGGEFCWICMRQWTDGCGFYRCGGNQTNPSMPEYRSSSPFSVSSNYPSSETPELGIPDVKTIQAKFIGQSSSSQNLRHR